MANTAPRGPEGKKQKHKIGEMPAPVQAEAQKAVEVVKHGQKETADQVKELEVERIKERIVGLKAKLEEIRQLAISEGCPDPKAKKAA